MQLPNTTPTPTTTVLPTTTTHLPTAPPAKASELYPGYNTALKDLQKQLYEADKAKNATQASLNLARLAVEESRQPKPLLPDEFYQQPLTPELAMSQLHAAQVEFDTASRNLNQLMWRQQVLGSLPGLLYSSTTAISKSSDILAALPNDLLAPSDTAWLDDVMSQVQELILKPEQKQLLKAAASPAEAKKQMLDAVLSKPPRPIRAVSQMTVEEIASTFTIQPGKLPTGMTEADVLQLLKQVELSPADMKELTELDAATKALQADWAEKQAYISMIREGVLSPDAPALSSAEFMKLLSVQPASASLQLLDRFNHYTARPLMAGILMGLQSIGVRPSLAGAAVGIVGAAAANPAVVVSGIGIMTAEVFGSSLTDLKTSYDNYLELGEPAWEALALSLEKWDVPWYQRMLLEEAFDPINYLGTFANLGSKLPYAGKYVKATQDAYNTLAEAPFKALTNLRIDLAARYATPTVHARNLSRQVFAETTALLTKQTGSPYMSWGIEDVDNLLPAVKAAVFSSPLDLDNDYVSLGRRLYDYTYRTQDDVTAWLADAGIKADISELSNAKLTSINRAFESAYWNLTPPAQSAAEILSQLGINTTDEAVTGLAKVLAVSRDTIIDSVDDAIKTPTVQRTLAAIMGNTYEVALDKGRSPISEYLASMGRILGWTSRQIDNITRSSLVTTIDRIWTAPMAKLALLFANFQPMNFVENSLRAWVGDASFLYPNGALPAAEFVRATSGLKSQPYEAVLALRSQNSLIGATNVSGKNLTTLNNWADNIPLVTKGITIEGKELQFKGIGTLADYQGWWNTLNNNGKMYYEMQKLNQHMAELAPELIDSVDDIMSSAAPLLADIPSITPSMREEVRRILTNDAIWQGPEAVLSHDIPIIEVNKRLILNEANKVLKPLDSIPSAYKQSVRDKIMSGLPATDIDNFITGVKAGIQESGIVKLHAESLAMQRISKHMETFIPEKPDDLLMSLGFVDELTAASAERISDARAITRARAHLLNASQTDKFYSASDKVIGEYIGESSKSVRSILDSIKQNMSGGNPGKTVLDFFPDESVVANAVSLPDDLASTAIGQLTPQQFRRIEDALDSDIFFLRTPAANPPSKLKGVGNEAADHLQETLGTLRAAHTRLTNPMTITAPQQTALDKLSDAILLKHENNMATRIKDRAIIDRAIAATPKRQRTNEWWKLLEQKRQSGAWDAWAVRDSELFEATENLKNGLMTSFGKSVTPLQPLPQVADKLTASHIARMMGVSRDSLDRALVEVGSIAIVRPKEKFVNWVYSRANAAATATGTTADAVGFSKDAIRDVYDSLWRQFGIDPLEIAGDPLAPSMIQLEELRQQLHGITTNFQMPNDDYLKYKNYIHKVADDVRKLPEFSPAPTPAIKWTPEMQSKQVMAEINERFSNNPNIWYHGGTAIEGDVIESGFLTKNLDEAIEYAERASTTGEPGEAFVYAVDITKASTDRSHVAGLVDNVELTAPVKPVASFDLMKQYPTAALSSNITIHLLPKIEGDFSLSYQILDKGVDTGASLQAEIFGDYMLVETYFSSGGTSNRRLQGALQALEQEARTKGVKYIDLNLRGDKPAYSSFASRLGFEPAMVDYGPWGGEGDLAALRRAVPVAQSTPSQQWWNIKEQAMQQTRIDTAIDFVDSTNENMFDTAMKSIFPFWNYESQKWAWLSRASLKKPALAVAVGNYFNSTDRGYVPVPFNDLQYNPLRGTAFGGLIQLQKQDYPEYFDSVPGVEFLSNLYRLGFYPGAHVMLPITLWGAATGKGEVMEIVPSFARTALDLARAIAPQEAGAVIDHFFPDRFRDYLTMMQLGNMGYDADTLWRKKQSGTALTEDEQRLWLQAEAEATGLAGALFEQTGSFRLRPAELTQVQEDMDKLVEKMTGVSVAVQKQIRMNYPATGKRFGDYFHLDILQQKLLYSSETYQKWQGMTTPLMPSSLQHEEIAIRDYYDQLDALSQDIRYNGLSDDAGVVTDKSIQQLTQDMVEGKITPSQWTDLRGSLLDKQNTLSTELGKRIYPDVPKTLEERVAYYQKTGRLVATLQPDQELMYLYYSLQPKLEYDWESGKEQYNFDAYYAKVDALLNSLSPEQKQIFQDRVQYNWLPMERLYWQTSREYIRPYNLVRDAILEQYSPDQRQLITEFETARGSRRQELQQLTGPDGQLLISGFSKKVSDARIRLRILIPELDAWLYFWGKTTGVKTPLAQKRVDALTKQYMNSSAYAGTRQ